MLLTPDPRKMKLVFLLSAKLKAFPEQVAAAQKLTLNELKPYGLKGSRGLFGSQEWWDNIAQGKIPLHFITGKIIKKYRSGQDANIENGFTLLLEDGSLYQYCIPSYTRKTDKKLFKLGAMVFAQDEMKRLLPNGEKDYLHILLQMAVSHDVCAI